MTEVTKKSSKTLDDSMKITVTRNGPYIVTGGVPLTSEEICNDDEGYCRTWRQVKKYPVQEQYALCRCGNSKNKPFCDGTHAKNYFDGTEAGDHEPYRDSAGVIRGPALTLTDNEHLCVHARFCMRAGGIWNLVKQSDNPTAHDFAIEEACNCPSGRLVVHDNATGKVIEPEFEKSIVIVEYPPRGEHGPLWVRGGISVISVDGEPYEIRNRVTLCRCGRSENKPFCDGSHVIR
ncbi:MAG: CDGSH iron-sulfur domain-containing protein [Methanoregula sp.]|nr:CDGSH iron-sulfur domain-containing protein [Methanoregula sp.]